MSPAAAAAHAHPGISNLLGLEALMVQHSRLKSSVHMVRLPGGMCAQTVGGVSDADRVVVRDHSYGTRRPRGAILRVLAGSGGKTRVISPGFT